MSSLVFDTGTIISLVTNNLLWILKPLKERFGGEFLMPKLVRYELVDRPIKSKKFKLEAIIIQKYFLEGVFKLRENKEIERIAKELLELANNIYFAKGKPIKIIQKAEMYSLAIVIESNSSALVVDERTLRLLIENPHNLSKLLSKRLHTKIETNEKKLNEFKNKVKNIKVIRSTELAVIAYDLGILNKYITIKKILYKKFKKDVLEGLLWGLKFKGCAISSKEIREVLKLRNF
jgi:hypothetical protein